MLSTHSLAAMMLGDLQQLERFKRALQAIFDIGYLYVLRNIDGSMSVIDQVLAKHPSPIAKFAMDSFTDIVVPACPGDHFAINWNMQETEWGKTLAWQQTQKGPHYKALAADYKQAPAAHIGLVSRVCDLELQMLCELAADGDPQQAVRAQAASACDWLATQAGDPPDAAGGVGTLLGMMGAYLKTDQDIPCPPGLLRLNMGVIALDALLSAADAVDASTRTTREQRIKGAVAKLLRLSGSANDTFTKGNAWDALFSSARLVKKGSATGVRAFQMAAVPSKQALQLTKEAVERLAKMDDALAGAPKHLRRLLTPVDAEEAEGTVAECAAAVAWLRAVGFIASGVSLVEDLLAMKDPDSDKLQNLLKDIVSTFGSIARDYAKTHKALEGPNWLKGPKWLEADVVRGDLVNKTLGHTLGVASAVWNSCEGAKKKDIILEASGVFSATGYGLRLLFEEDVLVVIGFDVTVPFLLIGAAFELWAGTQPKAADDAMKTQTMNMLRGVTQAMSIWYAARGAGYTPWRAADTPALETALANAQQAAAACEGATTWTAFLPYNPQDAAGERDRLGQIGFTDEQTRKLVPDELAIKYAFRGAVPFTLQPPWWPPQKPWPTLIEAVAAEAR